MSPRGIQIEFNKYNANRKLLTFLMKLSVVDIDIYLEYMRKGWPQ